MQSVFSRVFFPEPGNPGEGYLFHYVIPSRQKGKKTLKKKIHTNRWNGTNTKVSNAFKKQLTLVFAFIEYRSFNPPVAMDFITLHRFALAPEFQFFKTYTLIT